LHNLGQDFESGEIVGLLRYPMHCGKPKVVKLTQLTDEG
jgi:hypothetical protein